MSLFSFLSEKLSFILKKDSLLEEARITSDEFMKFCIPSYESTAKELDDKKFKNSEIRNWEADFKRTGLLVKGYGFFGSIAYHLTTINQLQLALIDTAEKKFEDKNVLGSITLDKANIIKIFALNRSVTRYSLKFLNYVLVHETIETNKEMDYIKNNLTLEERENVEQYYIEFFNVLKTLTSFKPEQAKEKIEETPAILAEQNEDILISTLGISKLDPLNIAQKRGFNGSPVLWFRENQAVTLVARYKEKEELKRILELRLMYLNNQNSGEQNAALEQQIEQVAARVDRLSQQMKEIEEKLQ